jgi:hypothetical protein
VLYCRQELDQEDNTCWCRADYQFWSSSSEQSDRTSRRLRPDILSENRSRPHRNSLCGSGREVTSCLIWNNQSSRSEMRLKTKWENAVSDEIEKFALSLKCVNTVEVGLIFFWSIRNLFWSISLIIYFKMIQAYLKGKLAIDVRFWEWNTWDGKCADCPQSELRIRWYSKWNIGSW